MSYGAEIYIYIFFSALNDTFECLKHVESNECRIKWNIWYYETNLQPSFAILEEIELVGFRSYAINQQLFKFA